MSTFLKFTLPALCAAAGLAVAICLATGEGELASKPIPVAAQHAHRQHPLNSFPDALTRDISNSAEVSQTAHNTEVAAPSRPATDRPGVLVARPNHASAPQASVIASDGNPSSIRVAQAPEGVDINSLDELHNLDRLRNPFMDDVDQPQGGSTPAIVEALDQLKSQLSKQNPLPLPNTANSSPDGTDEVAQPSATDLPYDNPEVSGTPPGPRSQTVIQRVPGEGDDRLSLMIPGEDLNKVLQMLSVQGDLNILASKNVQGTVSASLKNVRIETALDAILKSTGYIWWQDGRFIHVGTPQDKILMQQSSDKIGTRLYRPNYVKAADLQTLITPILTPTIGTISVTMPSQVGIAPDGNSSGGDGFAGQEALLVRDYEIVLAEVDQIVEQVDMRPTQVAIEAMILSVSLADKDELGVDFEVLRDKSHIRLASGNPLGSLAQMDFSNGGLKVGFLDSSLALFLNALETIGDTNVIATPRLMCLNKHRAEILIGEQLGYVSTTQTETSTTQSVEFLEVGTQLRLRPFISSDGMVRMEVHPELSTGNVRLEGNFTLPDKKVTQVTTNIMVRDGSTVIIGGLLRDEMSSTASQIPLLGSLPVVGAAFRQNSETLGRQEILVLITPRIIYEPDSACRGDEAAGEFLHRQTVYADQMLPFSKRYLGRKYFRLAQMAWDAGNARQALRLINLSIYFDPINRAAIDLRADIWNGNPIGDHTLPPERGGAALDEEEMPFWLMQRLDAGGSDVHHPLEPGRPGDRIPIYQPQMGPTQLPGLPRAEEPEPMVEVRSKTPVGIPRSVSAVPSASTKR